MTEATTSDTTSASETSPRPSEYEALGRSIGKLVTEKQAAYGDSFGKSGEIMRILYPDGIQSSQMDDALAITRMVDKLFRIATRKDAFGESPYKDIAGYAILGAIRHAKEKAEKTARRAIVSFESEIVERMAEEIKKEVDAEIIGSMLRPSGSKDYYKSSDWLLDKTLRRFNPGQIAEECRVTKRTILNWYKRHKMEPYAPPPRE